MCQDIFTKLMIRFHRISQHISKEEYQNTILIHWKKSGYETARDIEYVYATKKKKDENGDEITVEDKSKLKSFEGALIPRSIIERVYFADEQGIIAELMEKQDQIESDLEEVREEESGDDGLLKEVLSDKGELPKGNLAKRIKELETKKSSPDCIIGTYESV